MSDSRFVEMMVQRGDIHLSINLFQYVKCPDPFSRLAAKNRRAKEEKDSDSEDESVDYVNKLHHVRDYLGINLGFLNLGASDFKQSPAKRVVGDSMMLAMSWCMGNSDCQADMVEKVNVFRKICSHVPRRIVQGLEKCL